MGVFVSPHYGTDHVVYLTYAEPGDSRSSLPLARAKLTLSAASASLDDLRVIWRDGERGNGGQFGAQIAFSPDGEHLFLTVGDRQRMTPAQDPDQPLGKILRLTLDGKPAPGNPMAGKVGAARMPVIDPPHDTEQAKTAPVVRTYAFPGPNLTPAETWTSGHRTPYGLAFAPDGRVWEADQVHIKRLDEHRWMGRARMNSIVASLPCRTDALHPRCQYGRRDERRPISRASFTGSLKGKGA